MRIWERIKRIFNKPKEHYQIEIPKIQVDVEAPSKKQAFKEADKAVSVMLKQQTWWKEEKKPLNKKSLSDMNLGKKGMHQSKSSLAYQRKTWDSKKKPSEED